MTKITIETSDSITLPHTHAEAVLQCTRVVDAMARWFGVDVQAVVSAEPNPQGSEDRKIVSFSFSGDRANQARQNVDFFLDNNPDIKSAFIKPSQADRLAGGSEVKMDLDKLAKIRSNGFDNAVYDAGHNGSIISQRVSGEQGKGIAG